MTRTDLATHIASLWRAGLLGMDFANSAEREALQAGKYALPALRALVDAEAERNARKQAEYEASRSDIDAVMERMEEQ